MSAPSHTPGPWHYVETPGRGFVLDSHLPIGPFLGSVIASEGTNANAKADLCLISAAPEMLEALRAINYEIRNLEVPSIHAALDDAWNQVQKAIAKAEGKA